MKFTSVVLLGLLFFVVFSSAALPNLNQLKNPKGNSMGGKGKNMEDAKIEKLIEDNIKRFSSATTSRTTQAVTSQAVTSQAVTSQAVTSQAVTSGAVTSQAVTSQAVTSQEVTSAPVTSAEVTSQEVTSQEVTSQEVTSQEVTSQEVTSQEVTSQEVTSQEVTSQEVTSQEVTSQEVTSQEVTSQEVTSQEVTSQEVTSMEVTSQAVTSDSISTSEITSGAITTGTVACFSNADCNNQGVCESNGYCSCYSGYGGWLCDDAPSGGCSPNELEALFVEFEPDFYFEISDMDVYLEIEMDYEDSILSVDTESGMAIYSTDTTIEFDNSESSPHQDCNYPSPDPSFWTKYDADSESCYDYYVVEKNWVDFRDLCGFVKEDNSWSQLITFTRNYVVQFGNEVDDNDGVVVIGDGEFVNDKRAARMDLSRQQTMSRELTVTYPEEVVVSTDIIVSTAESVVVSAVISSEYDSDTNQWTFVLAIFTEDPYRLELVEDSASGEIEDDDRYMGATLISNPEGGCDDSGVGCEQIVTFVIDDCEAATGVVSFEFNPQCGDVAAEGITCAPVARPVNIDVTIVLGSYCPITETVDIATSELTSYDSPELDNEETDFRASDIAYFAANIQSDDVDITSKTIQDVCYTYGSGACTHIDYVPLASPDDEHDPAFSINLAPLYTLADEDGEEVTISAIIDLEWLGNDGGVKKRSETKVMDVDLSRHLRISKPASKESDAVVAEVAKPNGAISVQASIVLIATAVIAALLF